MADDAYEVRGISWSATFPFLRLFRTFRMAISPTRLALCLAAVVTVYVLGRLLDSIWMAASRDNGAVAAVHAGRQISEIAVYSTGSAADFSAWRRQTAEGNRQREIQAVEDLTDATAENAPSLVRDKSAAEVLLENQQDEVAAARQTVDDRLGVGLERVDADAGLSAEQKAERKNRLRRAADALRIMVMGGRPELFFSAEERSAALDTLIAGDPQLTTAQANELRGRIAPIVQRQTAAREIRETSPRGPFHALMRHEMTCFAAAVQGLCSGRLGFSGSILDAEPSMLGSVAAGAKGLLWLITQRPWFALLYGLMFLVVMAFFGGAVCRTAAVEAAREEQISMGAAVQFAREKLPSLVISPLMPIIFFVVIAVVLAIGGLVARVPILDLLGGVFYLLALLAGFALALILIAALLGMDLMWPTIAVEGTDSLDAMSRSFSYVGSRIWHALFYGLVLLVYGGLCFVMVRLIALLALKLTHAATAVGISFLGAIASSQLDTINKMDAMWYMPRMAELTLLPAAGAAPIWGEFWHAPLSWNETATAFLICAWVYLVVGLVAAFVMSFCLCGDTHKYLLLRREVDGTDYTEVFTDGEPDELPQTVPGSTEAAPPPGAVPPGVHGTPLPVVNPPPPEASR